jgi:hypothetical protein
LRSLLMLRGAVLRAVLVALGMSGCGDEGAGEDVSAAGNLVVCTAVSARDYAAQEEREGLQLIRDVPIVEARDALASEAGR